MKIISSVFRELITIAVMFLIVVLLGYLHIAAGKKEKVLPPPNFAKEIFAVDNTVHLVIFNNPGSRRQLMLELYHKGFYQEVLLWDKYFKYIDSGKDKTIK